MVPFASLMIEKDKDKIQMKRFILLYVPKQILSLASKADSALLSIPCET